MMRWFLVVLFFSVQGAWTQDTLKLSAEGLDTLETWQGVKYCKVKELDFSVVPEKGDKLFVKYTGYFENGTIFDSSGKGTFTFRLQKLEVIRGWDIILAKMKEGEKFKVFVPWKLAYGKYGKPPSIPRKANLVFDIELVRVVK